MGHLDFIKHRFLLACMTGLLTLGGATGVYADDNWSVTIPATVEMGVKENHQITGTADVVMEMNKAGGD